jgi:hypothetical protein
MNLGEKANPVRDHALSGIVRAGLAHRLWDFQPIVISVPKLLFL